jgi:hypothetical protein
MKVFQKQRTSGGTRAQTKIEEIKHTPIAPPQRGLKDNEKMIIEYLNKSPHEGGTHINK